MARFITVVNEYLDDKGNIKVDQYQFSHLTISMMEKYKNLFEKFIAKANLPEEEQAKNFMEDVNDMTDLMFSLVKKNHRNMTLEEFKDTFSFSDYMFIMEELTKSSFR